MICAFNQCGRSENNSDSISELGTKQCCRMRLRWESEQVTSEVTGVISATQRATLEFATHVSISPVWRQRK